MGWIGVDLDGTLAVYDKFVDIRTIGAPIAPMVALVRQFIKDGKEVRIMTARVSLEPVVTDLHTGEKVYMSDVHKAIEQWCALNIGYKLPVTCVKDFHMEELYDDRAIQVEKNTGRLVGYSTRERK